jgi:hypothetical protein
MFLTISLLHKQQRASNVVPWRCSRKYEISNLPAIHCPHHALGIQIPVAQTDVRVFTYKYRNIILILLDYACAKKTFKLDPSARHAAKGVLAHEIDLIIFDANIMLKVLLGPDQFTSPSTDAHENDGAR